MDSLLLFSHGSVLCGSGEALEAHAARLRERNRWSHVEIGYLNYSEPTFAMAAARLIAAGARRIIVAPYFLVSGYFVSHSLPPLIDDVRNKHPQIELVVAAALGYDTLLADAILESADNPLRHDQWHEALTTASRGCRASSECPLYGTQDCPRVPYPAGIARPDIE